MEEKKNFSKTNPKEFITKYGGTKDNVAVLAIENHLAFVKDDDDVSPQSVYNDTFSRFLFTLVNAGQAKTANLKLKDFADIKARSEYFRNKMYENELCPSIGTKTELSPAYTVKFATGEFKGMTPAQVILENPDNKGKLNSQYTWLKNNLQKFPNNQKIMDAIVDAGKLLSEGKLSADVTPTASVFEIYKPGMRPLQRKQREDGLCFVYDIAIKGYLDNKYPIEVAISNYYAPVIKNPETNMMNVQVSKMDKDSLQKGTINLSIADWNNIVYEMEKQIDAFYTIHAPKLFAKADKAYIDNMEAAKNANGAG